jgi:DnaJ-domain-containing protein 1
MNPTIFVQPNDSGGYRLSIKCAERDVFTELIDELKMIDPDLRQWQPSSRSWIIFDDDEALVWLAWAKNVHEAQIKHGEPSGRRESVPPRKAANCPQTAHAALHLTPDAPPELIKAAYRCLATLHHPDKGGDTTRMQLINAAYKQLAA